MQDKPLNLLVTALHRLPFDECRFRNELLCIADYDLSLQKKLETQYRENWCNAWIIVVQWDGSNDLDFGLFTHPTQDSNAQGAWLDRVLDLEGSVRRAAFFMHYVDVNKPLWYGEAALPLPPVSEAPQLLVEMLEYSSPD